MSEQGQSERQDAMVQEQGNLPAAYCYDPFNLRHHMTGHPENRERLRGTWDLLQQDGVLQNMLEIPSTPVSDERLLRIHTKRHLSRVRQAAERGTHLDPDTYVGSDSEEAARLACGGLCNLVNAVLSGTARNGFALVRPPGHHATPDHAMGFCLYNNVAVAARAAQEEHGVERVLIVDFDVHHGNGTQDAFYQDGSVMFFSTHQYPYYPGSGDWNQTGLGQGTGATVNVPFSAGVGDEGYQSAFAQILLPLAHRFRPDLILVSAGYDAHWNDPLASMQLTLTGYADLVGRLIEMADELNNGRIVFSLEGGYHLEVLAHAVLNTLRLLSDGSQEISDPLGPCPWPDREHHEVVMQVRHVHGLR
ncbi:MAG: histone deacetylase [Chloroflexota bacterium]|nr:histone deacetylase [Chloroflexota bacterium]